MMILGKSVLSPILVHKTRTLYCGDADLVIRLRRCDMAGTCRTYGYTLQIKTSKREFQMSFIWRWDVTKREWATRKMAKGL